MQNERRRWFIGLRTQFVLFGIVGTAFVIFATLLVVHVVDINAYSHTFLDHLSIVWVPLLSVLVATMLISFLTSSVLLRPFLRLVELISEFDPHRPSKEGLELTRAGTLPVMDEVDQLMDHLNALYDTVHESGHDCEQHVDSKVESLEESNETIRDYVFYMSHRLRTPLNIIRWSVDRLKSEELGRLQQAQRESVAELEEALISVLELADDLQDSLVMEQQDHITLRAERVDIRDVIDLAAGEVAVLAREKRVGLRWNHDETKPYVVRVDVERMTQAIRKLLENGVLYNSENGQVEIALTRVSENAPLEVCKRYKFPRRPGAYVRIAVRDTGIGIPDNESVHVFERFFRGKQAREQWVDGGGIGLSLAQSIVSLHRGVIWFVPSNGGGTTFYLTLPLVKNATRSKRP